MSNLAAVGGTITTLVGLGITLGFVELAFNFLERALPDGQRRRRSGGGFFGGVDSPRGSGRRNSNAGIFDTGRQRGGNLFAPPSFDSPRRRSTRPNRSNSRGSTRRPRQRLTGSNILDPGGRF